jgi:hypothetical protein
MFQSRNRYEEATNATRRGAREIAEAKKKKFSAQTTTITLPALYILNLGVNPTLPLHLPPPHQCQIITRSQAKQQAL